MYTLCSIRASHTVWSPSSFSIPCLALVGGVVGVMQELDNAQSRLGEQALLLKRAVCFLKPDQLSSPPPTGSTRIGDPPLVRHGCHRTRCDGSRPITSRSATNSLRAPDTRPSPQKSFYRQTDILCGSQVP